MAAAGSNLVELDVGKLASGGACVARHRDGRVVFVRHALPNERVVARITGVTSSFLRADAVEILEASPARIEPCCPAAGPGRCGGCDFQHVRLTEQRRLKAALVEELLARIAHHEQTVALEATDHAPDGLGWRTKVRFAVDSAGRLGLRRHRSKTIVPVAACPLATESVEAVGAEQRRWHGAGHVEVRALAHAGETRALVLVQPARSVLRKRLPHLDEGVGIVVRDRVVKAPGHLEVSALGHRFQVGAGSFWQVHRDAPDTLARALLEMLDPQPEERVADLYAGVGLFSAVLAHAVGEHGRVVAIEQNRSSTEDAAANLARWPWAEVRTATVCPATLGELGRLDLIVLDPPREGAGMALMAAIAELDPPPRALAYVACDAATFARDVGVLRTRGWAITHLRAFDLFPMTEHVELIARLEPPVPGRPRHL
jgi:tRNA/tmRNA/rRNA uracil-C5-methylase (TrmA/RlmC/RlmD family)